jgi:hypothetical protein
MLEIIKTLLVSLSFAATGAGIAWSVTSDTREPFASSVVESGSNEPAKDDRSDVFSSKADRLETEALSRNYDTVIIYASGEASGTIFRSPILTASAR